MSQCNIDRTKWIGVSLLVIGIAYLSKSFHWEFFHVYNFLPSYFFSWEVILVVVGFMLMFFGRGTGLILVLLGTFFLFTDEIIFLPIGHIRQWWPIALVIVGVLLLTRSKTVQKN